MPTLEQILSVLVIIASLTTRVVGIPSQIRILLRKKDSSGNSLVYSASLLATYMLWTAYAIVKSDWVITFTSIVGICTSGVLTFLILYYRPKKQNQNWE